MTGLWTNDLDNLADALRHMPYTSPRTIAQTLHDNGVVRVLDPDDTELVERVADVAHRGWHDSESTTRWEAAARAVIEALRQP